MTNVYLETVLPIIGEVCKNHQTCIDNPFINIYWILDKRPQVQLLCMERKERFEAQTSFFCILVGVEVVEVVEVVELQLAAKES